MPEISTILWNHTVREREELQAENTRLRQRVRDLEAYIAVQAEVRGRLRERAEKAERALSIGASLTPSGGAPPAAAVQGGVRAIPLRGSAGSS
jgi:hypothetical protein